MEIFKLINLKITGKDDQVIETLFNILQFILSYSTYIDKTSSYCHFRIEFKWILFTLISLI